MQFEDQLKQLQEIVNQMSNQQLPLEKSLELFEQGEKLSKQCQQTLAKAEQKIKVLQANDS